MNKEETKEYMKSYYLKHKAIIKARSTEYNKTNNKKIKDYKKIYSKNYYKKNKEKKQAYQKENKERIRENGKRWRMAHPEKVKQKNNTLSHRMSVLVRKSLIQGKNGWGWETLVGFSAIDLKEHLEKQFVDGMTWDAFERGEIHIDHRVPISVFNFTKPEHADFKKAWALDNLQPMWAKDNLEKGAKLNEHFQPSLLL